MAAPTAEAAAEAGVVAGADVVDETGRICELNQTPSRHIILQWHITDQCNLRCRHCYQHRFTDPGFPLETLNGILSQYRRLLEAPMNDTPPAFGHINLTGGEPLLHPAFDQLIEVLDRQSDVISYALLTNGTLINRDVAARLGRFRPRFVQVSLDGTEATHDRIRGPGSFAAATAGMAALVAQGLRVFIALTIHRDNQSDINAVIRLGRRLGVARVWADRWVPIGPDTGCAPLDPNETRRFCRRLAEARKWEFFRKRPIVATHRALQFSFIGGQPYHCTAGDTLVTILSNGDVMPCRRLPIVAGNVLCQDLRKIYRDAPLFRQLRAAGPPTECEECAHAGECRGGLRCLAYASTGRLDKRDPGCWRL